MSPPFFLFRLPPTIAPGAIPALKNRVCALTEVFDQVYKIGQRYVLLYEGYNGGTRWGADVATSTSLTAGWKKAPTLLIDQTQWPSYSDETLFHVATPALYQFRRKWYLYFQGAHSGFYIKQHWALWGMRGDEVLKRIAALP